MMVYSTHGSCACPIVAKCDFSNRKRYQSSYLRSTKWHRFKHLTFALLLLSIHPVFISILIFTQMKFIYSYSIYVCLFKRFIVSVFRCSILQVPNGCIIRGFGYTFQEHNFCFFVCFFLVLNFHFNFGSRVNLYFCPLAWLWWITLTNTRTTLYSSARYSINFTRRSTRYRWRVDGRRND